MLKQKIKEAKSNKKKLLAVLIDPDKAIKGKIENLLEQAEIFGVDIIFFGGSLVESIHVEETLEYIKSITNIPAVLFPGSNLQVSAKADAILFLSLVSGRNPEFLIGNQVVAAPLVKASNLEVISTAYMLIDGGRITTANYISNTLPIPRDKTEISNNTAIAAELLGFDWIYMDAGSGALFEVPSKMIREVCGNVQLPVVVGGGIDSTEKLKLAYQSGADIVVIGTSIENKPDLLKSYCDAKNVLNENSLINL